MDVTTIRDPRFLTWFYFNCCHRSVTGPFNQRAIAVKLIEVQWMEAYGPQLEIGICDTPGNATIELGWNLSRGAWPIYYTEKDSFLGQCNLAALSMRVRRLLTKHGLIDRDGALIRKDVA